MIVRIQVRRGTSTQWTSANPVLHSGEFGYETDTGKIKIGNGTDAWHDLSYLQGTGGGGADGLSAYEIAVQNGFEGTEQEWLASLQGANGIDGTNGTDGLNGESAYDIAVDNGFVGTKQEWLESLSPVRYMDGDIFYGNGETPETKTTIKDGSIEESKLSEEVRSRLNDAPEKYYRFDGTAYATLPDSYILTNIGDYIQWEGRERNEDGDEGHQSTYLFGEAGTWVNFLGYYNKTHIRIQQNTGEAFDIAHGVDIEGFHTFRLEVNASNQWELFVNNVSVGTAAKTGNILIGSIANNGGWGPGQFLSKVDLKNLTLHTSTQDQEITDFTELVNTNVEEVIIEEPDISDIYHETYVSYDPNGSSGNGMFTVYTKYSPSSTFYAGYTVAHFVDSGTRTDVWRISGANLFQFINGEMETVGFNLIQNGDSECVWKEDGKTDFTGGYHGDEELISANFYMGGVKVNLSTGFDLEPCSKFHYEMKSNMFETDNPTDVIRCQHHKITTIAEGGYKTFNRLIWDSVVGLDNINICYFGLTDLGSSQSEVFYSENLNYVTALKDEVEKINEVGARTIRFYNTSTGLSAEVTSRVNKIKLPDNTDKTKEYDEGCTLVVWDRNDYSKYYRRMINKTPVTGEIWEGECEVKHFKQ